MPRLPLRPLPGPLVLRQHLPAVGPVLWLEPPAGPSHPRPSQLDQLRQEIGAQAQAVALRVVPLAGPSPGRNPWAVRQDRQEPLRWGPGLGLEGARDLGELGLPPIAGVVFAGLAAVLADQPMRTLLRQLCPLLVPDAPFVAVEPNGRFAGVLLARFGSEQTGEGSGTVRAVEELRRLLETGGLGVQSAFSLPPSGRRARLGRALLGEDAGAPWYAVVGRAIRGGEALR